VDALDLEAVIAGIADNLGRELAHSLVGPRH
jgi:hypothetical protein